MRRASVIGPLLLIGIGVVFLLYNLNPGWFDFGALVRLWPGVLILWGLLRVVEILRWQQSGKPLPAGGISGGEWALVVLVSVAGLSVMEVRQHILTPNSNFGLVGVDLFRNTYDFPVNAEQTVGAQPRILIENLRGDIRIVGADTDKVSITGRKSIRCRSQAEADAADKATGIEVVAQGGQVTVRTNQHRATGDLTISHDLEITVPRTAGIEAQGRRGDWDVTSVSGPVVINSDNAGVRVQQVGQLRVDLRRSDMIRAVQVAGDVEVEGRGNDLELEDIQGQVTVKADFGGELRYTRLAKPLVMRSSNTELRVARIPGEVRLEGGELQGTEFAGPFFLRNTRSKDVRLHNYIGEIDVQLDKGDVELQPARLPLAKVNVSTRAGNVQLVLPQGAQFALDARTDRGDCDNRWGEPFKTEGSERSGRMAGKNGNGPELTVQVSRGSVTLEKGGEVSASEFPAPAPQNPPVAPGKPAKAGKPVQLEL